MEILVATSNKGKIDEFSEIMDNLGLKVFSVYEKYRDFIMPDETGGTFEENAELKACSAYNFTGVCSIADDSGLEVDALGGAPGIYSARYAGENASDKDKIDKLLSEMDKIPDEQRTARFVCEICCVLPGGERIFSRGECEGRISRNVSGDGGFGYDPIFLIHEGRTFAELSSQEKNRISHRGIALRKLYSKLKDKIKEYK